MSSTLDSSPAQIPIRFADPPRRQSQPIQGLYNEDDFGIWSCRFSADGNEVVAGGSGKIFGMSHLFYIWPSVDMTLRAVYDLLADRRTVKIAAHDDDVNSCCWADSASGNVLISASDDSFIKVWYTSRPLMSPKIELKQLHAIGIDGLFLRHKNHQAF